MIKVDIDMPKMCCDCPMEDILLGWERRLAESVNFCRIKDLSGRVLNYQTVSTREEIEAERRSDFCPLQECE